LNHIDIKYPDVIYILPENFVEIPFELFRAAKRGNIPLYDSEEERLTYKEEYLETSRLDPTSSLTYELVKFISRHFFDAKIANPDLKEVYLTRLNILM